MAEAEKADLGYDCVLPVLGGQLGLLTGRKAWACGCFSLAEAVDDMADASCTHGRGGGVIGGLGASRGQHNTSGRRGRRRSQRGHPG